MHVRVGVVSVWKHHTSDSAKLQASDKRSHIMHVHQTLSAAKQMSASWSQRTFRRPSLCHSVSVVGCSDVKAVHRVRQVVRIELRFVLTNPSLLLSGQLCRHLWVRALQSMPKRGLLFGRECAHVLRGSHAR